MKLLCTTLLGTLAGLAPLRAQLPQGDPLALLELQSALGAAVDRVAPAVVRVEGFGGTRSVLRGDGGGDQLGGPQQERPLKYKPDDLEKLFERIDPDELARLWQDAGLEPKADDQPFQPTDLEKLGEARLRALFQRYRLGPYAPRQSTTPQGFVQGSGATTGLVLSSDGWVAISRFALASAPTALLVTLADGRSFDARRAGEDTSRGLALVKIDAEDLPTVPFADPREVAVGQWAFVLGRTFARAEERPSVHLGIVAAHDRLFGRALQIDADTSPANYGGPVIDLHGRVLGLAMPLSPQGRDAGVDWYDSGIGFAVTLYGQDQLLERLRAGEIVHRGWLGVRLRPDDFGPGAVLSEVRAGSPAAGLALQAGDRIITVAGETVRNAFHLQVLLGRHLAGDPVALTYRRGDRGDPVALTVFLAELPAAERVAGSRGEESFELPWEGDAPADPGGGR